MSTGTRLSEGNIMKKSYVTHHYKYFYKDIHRLRIAGVLLAYTNISSLRSNFLQFTWF
jgi:hypothetical protein